MKVENNCTTCSFAHLKDVNFDESNPEYVYICGKDNHYIGYPEDARSESCKSWKTD